MNKEYLSISEINNYIKSIFDKDEMLSNIYLKGEISNFKRQSSGHCYFTLKDENSRLRAVMFRYDASKLEFNPTDGMGVLVKGKISTYVPSGEYQIIISSMNEDGVGDLYIKYEELKKRLASEGLFSTTNKKKIPSLPKKIGIITASTGAAVKDIITTINRRFPLCETLLFPTLVQGEEAKENIVKMIKLADTQDVDVIILGRGGGSIEDLWAFNEEIVARAIYNANTPIISAVGHEIDFTISDFVADLRAPTPTAAAELAVPDKKEVKKELNNTKIRINESLKSKVKHSLERLNKYKENYILNNPKSIYEIKEQKLDILNEKINNNINNILDNYKNKFININTKIELLNPISVLNKGYSITTINDKVINNINQIKENDEIKTKIKTGIIISKVKEVK